MTQEEKNREYWSKRSAKRLVKSEKEADRAARVVTSVYERALSNIQLEVNSIYENYSEKGILNVSELKKAVGTSGSREFLRKVEKQLNILGLAPEQVYDAGFLARLNRLEILQEQIRIEAMSIAPQEERITRDSYKSVLENDYAAFQKDAVTAGMTPTFATLDQPAINTILSAKWQGRNFSASIWGNTAKLARELPEILGGGLAAGQSSGKTARQIADRFGVAISDANRLTRTENSFIQGQSELQSYVDDGIEKYEFDATIDGRTSEICRHLNGMVFLVEDAQVGVNYNPMHSHCRSRAVAYFGDKEPGELSGRIRAQRIGTKWATSKERFARFDQGYEDGAFKTQFYKTMRTGNTELAVQRVEEYRKYGTLEKIPETMQPVSSTDELSKRWGNVEVAKGSAGEKTILVKLEQGGDKALNAEAEWISQSISNMKPEKQQDALRRLDGIINQMQDSGQKKQVELLKKYVGIPQVETVSTSDVEDLLKKADIALDDVTLSVNQQNFIKKSQISVNNVRSGTDDIGGAYNQETNTINLDVGNLKQFAKEFNNPKYVDQVFNHELGHVIDRFAPQLRNDTPNFSDSDDFKNLISKEGNPTNQALFISKNRIADSITSPELSENLRKMSDSVYQLMVETNESYSVKGQSVKVPLELYKYHMQPDELFAESYSLYHVKPDLLKKNAPDIFNYIDQVEQKKL